jgi:putative cell wall-binding protein
MPAAADSDPVVPPASGMGEYPAEAYSAEAATLDPGLVDAVARDLGETGEEYLANAEAAADASYVVEDLTDQGYGIRGSQIEGTELTVYVDAGDATAAAAAEASGATVSFSDPPEFSLDTSGAVPLADLYDGQGWGFFDTSGQGSACSVGFVGRTASVNQFVTAGHCFPPGSTIAGPAFVLNQSNAGANPTPGASLGSPVASSFRFGGGSDSGRVTVQSGWTLKPQVVTWGGAKGAALASTPLSVTDSRAAVTGASLCKSGERTGWSCGSILAVDYDLSVGDKVVNSIIATTCADHGDSGGAAVSGTTAVGLTSAGPDTSIIPCGSSDYFSSYFPMVSVAGKASVNSTQTGWEPLVTVASPAVTSPPNGGTVIQNGSMTGTLANANATNRVKVVIAGDALSPRVATVGSGGAWTVSLNGLAAGAHTYTVTGTWNTYSTSADTTGSFTTVARPTTSRLAGDNRYATAVAIASAAYPTTADVVYVATGDNYPDALSAAPAAVAEGAPLLLVPSSGVPSIVSDKIGDLAPDQIVVVGGPAAVPAAVFDELSALAPTVRVSGATRYETSRLISERAFGARMPAAYVATGSNFPDALSASAVAAGRGAPVILVPGGESSVDSGITTFIRDKEVASIFIAGGTSVVSPSIQAQLDAMDGVSVERYAGEGRTQTSAVINHASFTSSADIFLATGATFPDALAGAALAGAKRGALYVIPEACIPSYILDDIAAFGAERVTLLGGTAALKASVGDLTTCG